MHDVGRRWVYCAKLSGSAIEISLKLLTYLHDFTSHRLQFTKAPTVFTSCSHSPGCYQRYSVNDTHHAIEHILNVLAD